LSEIIFKDYPDFRPDLTPEEVMLRGSFGGTYFRPIYCCVTGKNYKNVHREFSWAQNVDEKKMSSQIYQKEVNRYKVECGSSLELWQSKNWIKQIDPYGWFQWYCRFYEGRRCYDDKRQIGRWKKIKTRFMKYLLRRPPSKKVCQVFQHWALDPEKYTL
jgi:hypothetical protein